jgi:quinolinate synthase
MTDKEAKTIIAKIRVERGESLVILGHHYQRDDILAYADYVGDSLELARKASQIDSADSIVFCGVYFMAETAAILAPGRSVYIPDTSAGCPLADMARLDDVMKAWDVITRINPSVVPVTYVNSSADLKAFCGKNDGIVCTSGNARRVMEWALERAEKVFFMPDMNLGRNTARTMDIPDDEIIEWDHRISRGGVDTESIAKARVILWKGWCPVHCPRFTVEDIGRVRARYPGIKIIVHPETDPAVVRAADISGSTSRILEYLKSREEGATVAVGTEANMVFRAARDHGSRIAVVPLKEVYCEDMARITLEKLAQTLRSLGGGTGRVVVTPDTAGHAKKALDRMLRI